MDKRRLREGLYNWANSDEITYLKSYIQTEISSLNAKNNKKEFREKCLQVVDYLISQKYNVPSRSTEERWKEVLSFYLQLSYEAEDFCEGKTAWIQELNNYKRLNKNSIICNGDSLCMSKCNQYNVWIEERKKSFYQNSIFSEYKSKNIKSSKIKFPSNKNCKLLNTETFNQCECLLSDPSASENLPPKSESEHLQIQHEQSASHNQNPPQAQSPHLEKSNLEESVPQESPTKAEKSQIESIRPTKDANSEISTFSESESPKSKEHFTLEKQNQLVEGEFLASGIVSETTELSVSSLQTPYYTKPLIMIGPKENSNISYTTSVLISFLVIFLFVLFVKYALMRLFKKKKDIKRRQVKFFRLLIPSISNRKNKFLIDDHLEHITHDDKEIIKKIEINELNTKKNVNLLKQKKDRSKTIIEVHMEVLEKCRNEELEYKKLEYLEICLNEFTKKEYTIHSNLKNDEIIMEDIKTIEDTENKIFLWNKWVKRYRNLSQKLKKEEWFNNLKNEWKKEQVYAKKKKEIQKNLSDENQNFLYLEREKDIWKNWLPKKGAILEQYLEQKLFKELTEELQIMTNEYKNEQTRNNISLVNMMELQHIENYEELYKYIKKKLVPKLCILVFMMVFEECEKEEYIENRESYLDDTINECKTKKNSKKEQEIKENIIEINDFSENRINREIHRYT
ncbi:STP1 protein [Plasmodium brasilianum]|uniref:STP1 protein n=1 Tax=Plasmodium brasilianum TaxID=5824 RepID=A0ACB9Y884_PLABR|nr:STP1 protein [Plasmodium brasilianum]